jgi:hypothetical protein
VSENVWGKIVELGRQYIKAQAELTRLEAIRAETPPKPDLIETVEEYADYMLSLADYKKKADEAEYKRLAVKGQLMRLKLQLVDVLPFHVWVRVDYHKFRYYQTSYGDEVEFEDMFDYDISLEVQS